MTKSSPRVALILDTEFGKEGTDICKQMPVWIITSELNRPIIDVIRNSMESVDVTTFTAKDGETRATTCERIVASLDDHFNEYSQTPGYHELNVIGVPLEEVDTVHLKTLGFIEFISTRSGFITRKRAANPTAGNPR